MVEIQNNRNLYGYILLPKGVSIKNFSCLFNFADTEESSRKKIADDDRVPKNYAPMNICTVPWSRLEAMAGVLTLHTLPGEPPEGPSPPPTPYQFLCSLKMAADTLVPDEADKKKLRTIIRKLETQYGKEIQHEGSTRSGSSEFSPRSEAK